MKRALERWPWDPYTEPRVQMREELQRVAFALAERKSRNRPCGVVFTSPTLRAGASTVVIGVARELQRSPGIRCAVVELNRLRPCFATRFELDSKRTVSALASRDLTLPECTQKVSGGILVVPAGGEWSASEAARIACQAMQDAESEFDVVLFDAPASTESADAMAIGSAVKDMIVVAAAGRTTIESLDRIKIEAATNGVKILGSVLTMRDRVAPAWLFGRRRR